MSLTGTTEYALASTNVGIEDPGHGYNVELSSPFAALMKNRNEVVNPSTGSLMVTETDLYLPGKNGLDFSLTRVYRSEKSELDRIKADFPQKFGDGYIVTNHTYGGNYLENLYHLGVGWGFDLPSIDIDAETGATKYVLHLGQGQTYQIDWSNTITGLKDISIKEYIVEKYSSSNFPMARYRLKYKTGINYYFDLDGRLLKIKNRYGDEITFEWEFRNGGFCLDKIVDSVNRTISFTYTDQLVTVTLQSNSNPYIIKYYKESVGDGHYKLARVELPEQTNKLYSYNKGQTEFGFWVDENWNEKKLSNRYFMLLTTYTNPYGGQTVYSYDRNYRRQLDQYGGYEKYYKINGRYDYLEGKKQNEIKYQYHDYYYGATYQTDIYYYGNSDTLDYSKKEVLHFNKNHENDKVEVYLADKPTYIETKTTLYNDEKPELIKILKADLKESSNPDINFIDLDYDEYGTLVYQGDSSERKTVFDYSGKTTSEFDYQVLNWKRTQVNPFGSEESEFIGEQYSYDQYGNILSVKEQELNMDLITVTDNIVTSNCLDASNEKYVKELPKWSKKVDFSVYYFAGAPWGNANFEVRYWAKGETRPENCEKSYVLQGALFKSHEGYIKFSLTLPDTNKNYYVEILATNAGTWGSNVKVSRMDTTYDKLVVKDSVIKSTIHNHYSSPGNSVLPDIVHKEYGSVSTHNQNFNEDNCIITEYEYKHSGIDDVVEGENYDNIFPTKVTNYVTDVDGVLKPVVTESRYNRFGQITSISKFPSKDVRLINKYYYDDINRVTEETFSKIQKCTNFALIVESARKTYTFSPYPDVNGLFKTTVCKKGPSEFQLGQQTTFYYNGLGEHLETRKGREGHEILVEKIGYDEFGRKEFIKDGCQIRTEYDYDGFGRLKEVRMPDQTKKVIEFNDVQREVTEEIYDLVNGSYKLIGKSIKHLDNAGNTEQMDLYPNVADSSIIYTTKYTYNLADQVTSITDPRGIRLNYEYDFFGVKKIDYPGTIRYDDVFSYDYQNKDKLNKQKRAGNYILSYLDELDNVRKVTYPDGRVLKNYYDNAGRLSLSELSSLSETSKIEYIYYRNSNVSLAKHLYDGKDFIVDFDYDLLGNLSRIKYPNDFEISYQYDLYGRVECIPEFVPNISENKGVTYLNNGFMKKLVYSNGITTDFTPDIAGRVERIKSNVMDYRYEYDGKGNVKKITSYNPTNGSLINDYNYIYNDIDWLKEADQDANYYIYDYDQAGNRIKKTINGNVTNYTYSPNDFNLLTAINGTNISYDKWGNINQRENGFEYIYNDSNQLIEVQKKGRTVGKYYYNSEGKRYKKVEDGLTTYYVYSGENILYEEKSDGTKICYIYLNGRQIAKVEEKNGVQKKYFYHTDHLGSTRAVTDESGNVVGIVDYKPFGDEKPYFPGRDENLPNQSSFDSLSDISGRLSGSKELSTDRIEGNYSILVKTGDVTYDFGNYGETDRGYMDTEEEARYYHLWVKPEDGAEWVRIYFDDIDDPNISHECALSEDGDYYFRVGQELEKDKWNLILLDARESHVDGVDKGISYIHWHTDEYSQWKWDYMGVSVKDPVTFTGKQQDDPTGLYYFNARYYDSNLGRFISEDPAKDGANWYSYCGNNPLKYVDPSGEKKISHNWLMGILAHQVIQADFLFSNLSGHKIKELSIPGMRADLFCWNDYPFGVIEIGEIKPDSHLTDPKKRALGIKQLQDYLKGYKQKYFRLTKPLTRYNPTNPLPIPGTNWTIFTSKDLSAPGMYYYYIDDGEPLGTAQPSWSVLWRFGEITKYLL